MKAAESSADRSWVLWVSLGLFSAVIGLMAFLKLRLFPDRYVALGYALPLLLCLWHRDRRLLWAMVVGLAAMSALKGFLLIPPDVSGKRFELLQWSMQLTNILVVAVTVHTILNLTDRLRARNAELRQVNSELVLRQEEIARQNAELQAQSEELVQQNEELHQQREELTNQNEQLQSQGDELERQSKELQAQADQLHTANLELEHRETLLRTVLRTVGQVPEDRKMLHEVCRALIAWLGGTCRAAAVVDQVGDQVFVRTHAGTPELDLQPRPWSSSFAAVVVEHNRTAFIDDIVARLDLSVAQPAECPFRSVLGTPLRLDGRPIGVIQAYSSIPQKWTPQQFRIIEWVAAQCSLALGIVRLRDDLTTANSQLEQQVRDRTAKLQEMVGELEHFSYTITHDMRAPLRAIQGFVGMLKELVVQTGTPETQDCLSRISVSIQRMDRLITDALSYSRAVEQELALTPVDSAALLQGMVQCYPQFQPPWANIEIVGELPIVLANEAGLTQCFSNLLDNAVKFVQPGKLPEVRIWAESGPTKVRLWFEDNGIGIPPAMLPRIFQMFQRAARTYEGTGIGLALVRKVAERMNGRVGVESEPGKGSRFWLELRPAGQGLETHEDHSEIWSSGDPGVEQNNAPTNDLAAVD